MNSVILAWTFSPPNYFEEPTEIHGEGYVMTIGEGKAEARIELSVFDHDPSIRQVLHEALNDRLLGVQLLAHKPYELEKSTIVREEPDGRRNIFSEPEPARIAFSGGTLDTLMTDKDGKIVVDSRRDRIEKKRSIAELVAKHRAKDALLAALLNSYQASVVDPDNELVHLYEIRDALSKSFGDSARGKLGLSQHKWSRLGTLANVEPLRQGRHRGKAPGALRDATQAELEEARGIARHMIEAYLGQLLRE